MVTNRIDHCVLEAIERYKNLNLGGKHVVCPYHINPKTQRANLRVLAGKGNPEEIELETSIYAKLGGLDLENMSSQDIRKFMSKRHIGIDCSGYVVHLLDVYAKEKRGKRIWDYIKKPNRSNIYSKMRYKLRPVENIGVADLTSDINAEKISKISDIQVGDLIKTHGLRHKDGLHILLVIETVRDDGHLISFKYTNSNRYYGDGNGIREGEVQIEDETLELKDQNWVIDKGDKCYEYEGLLVNYEKNGIFRIKGLID